MFKAGRSRFAFLLAAILVLTLGVTLVGSTLATSFGDPVDYSTALQSLEGGNTLDYKVYLKYHNGSAYTVMDSTNVPFSSNTLWCPGKTEIAYLQLINDEAFPVDCVLSMDISVPEGGKGFDNTLSYAVINRDLKAENAAHPTSWIDFVSESVGGKDTTLGDAVLLGDPTPLDLSDPYATFTLHSKESTWLAVAIHMAESATSEYAGRTLNLNFKLGVNANFESGTTLESLQTGTNSENK